MARRLFLTAEQATLFLVGVIDRGGVDSFGNCHVAGRFQTDRPISGNRAADEVEAATRIGSDRSARGDLGTLTCGSHNRRRAALVTQGAGR
ncbi:hypothetical protein D3C87_1876060 [compost metagenome]